MKRAFSLGVCLVSLRIVGAQICLAQVSPERCAGGEGKPEICVRFDNREDPPVEFTHFEFVMGNRDKPGVLLIKGTEFGQLEWRIWCWDDNEDPADISSITAFEQDDFAIRILNPAGAAGADDIEEIILDPLGTSNFSKILDGTMTGNFGKPLGGELFVERSTAAVGGTVDFTIEGNVLSRTIITLPRGENFTVEQSLWGSESFPVEINIEEINGGDFTVGEYADHTNLEVEDSISNGSLLFGLSGYPLSITIDEMGSDSHVKVGYLDSGEPANRVSITVDSDLPSDATIEMIHTTNSRPINFGVHDIDGTILIGSLNDEIIARDLTGTVDIKTNFNVDAKLDLSGSMSGTASFKVNSDEGNGRFRGLVEIDGDMTDSALIKVFEGTDGLFEGSGSVSILGVSGVGSSASIVLEGDANGDITITNDLNGRIEIGGAQGSSSGIVMRVLKASGRISIAGNAGGVIQTSGNLAGDVFIGVTGAPADLTATGSIDVGGTLKGDIVITRDVVDGASISANKLGADGRILIDGLCDAGIVVNKGTNATSLIRMTLGLDDHGLIVINDSETSDKNADGDIFIGDPAPPQDPGFVVFDGCIRVKENPNPPGGGGDLNGDIDVVGCHATSADLNICIDGNVNGSITIEQTDCDPQVTHSCDDNCPPA